MVPNDTVERRADRSGETIYSAAPPSRIRAAERRTGRDRSGAPRRGRGHDDPSGEGQAAQRSRRTPLADAALEPGAAPSREERVGAALRHWRGELAATGGPNALLWYRDSPTGTLDLTETHPTGVSILMAGNRVLLSHLVREQGAFQKALAAARRIRAKALELHDDHGLDAGYVCVGMATWPLPGTSRRPLAPIMLRAARLHAVDAAETDIEIELSSRIEINSVFLHYMASQEGVRISGEVLADLAHSTGRFDPFPVYRELQRALAGVPEFAIVDRRVISTFATTKMAMVADLAAFADRLAGNDVIAALAGDPTAQQALRGPGDGHGELDRRERRPAEPDVDDDRLVLDADSAQQGVVDAARNGEHVLIDAAPGTGATQTLANVAAALVAGDQRVLVISESARQLTALIEHLDRAGLRDLVLDARDPDQLRRTLAADIIARVEGRRDVPSHGDNADEESAAGEVPDDDQYGASADGGAGSDESRYPYDRYDQAGYDDDRYDESGYPYDPYGEAGYHDNPYDETGYDDPYDEDRRAMGRTAEPLKEPAESVEPALDDPNGPPRDAASDPSPPPADSLETPWQKLAGLRARLHAHSRSLHAKRAPWGVSVFDAQTALATLSARPDAPTSRARISPAALRSLTRERLGMLADEAARLAAEGAWTTVPGDEDPWWGAHLPTPDDARRAVAIAADLARGRLAADRQLLDAVLADAGLPPAHSVREWVEALDLVAAVRDTLTVFRPEVYAADLPTLIAATNPAAQSRPSWWARGGYKRQARALVLPHARIEALHESLRRAEYQRRQWASRSGGDAAPRVPRDAAEAHVRCAALRDDLAWLDEVLAGTPDGPGLATLALDRLQARLADLAARAERAMVVPGIYAALTRLVEAGLGELLHDLARRRIPPARVADEAEFVWWLSILDVVAQDDPGAGAHDGAALRAVVREYVECDLAAQAAWAGQVRERAQAHARVQASIRPDEVDALREAAAYERLPRPARAMLADCGEVVAAVAPIWVLSPLTLAAIVPTRLTFDAVLIDDAGRMPVAHAVSALARGAQVVVAGDLQGLGPRQFQTVAVPGAVDEQDGASTSGVSVLAALSAYLSPRHLTRSYGDRDARLVAFAAGRREETVHAWAAPGNQTALRLVRTGAVISCADPAGEAESRENNRVVELALEHLHHRPEASLAVVAFSAAQADRIDEQLRQTLTRHPRAAAAPALAEGFAERLLITTADRAAGATRDTVVLATGLVPLPEAQLHAPERLHRPDGERLVDSVVGIARRRLDVVSALTATEMAQICAWSPGQDRLARLLAYAERGGDQGAAATDGLGAARDGERGMARDAERGRMPDDGRHALLGELAARLRSEGLVVHEGYGIGAASIDLAVEDPYAPATPTVAVLSDGARFATAATVRERERLWPEQLGRLGWRCVRVWSTDVFRDPARDVARIVEAVRGGRA